MKQEELRAESAKKLQFSEQMKRRILAGNFHPGDRLPSERELAVEYGLSRGSVNQGILDLERAGFLRVVPRKGTFVADYVNTATGETLSAIMAHDSPLIDRSLFADFMAMRILIERECVRLACTREDRESSALLASAAADIFNSSEEEFPSALYGFHLSIVLASGNSAYVMIFRSFETMLKTLIAKHYSSADERLRDLRLYSELAVAMLSRDAARSDALLLEILQSASRYLAAHA